MIGPTNANARYVKAISSSTNDHVVTFNGTGGNTIKDSGKTIGVSIPAPNTSTDVGMSLVVQNDGSLSYGVPPGNYVTLNTGQTITGDKTFTGNFSSQTGNTYDLCSLGGYSTAGSWFKLATLTYSGSPAYIDRHIMFDVWDNYAYSENPIYRVGTFIVHSRISNYEMGTPSIAFISTGVNIVLDDFAIEYDTTSKTVNIWIKQRNSYSNMRFIRRTVQSSSIDSGEWTLYHYNSETTVISDISTLTGTIVYASGPILSIQTISDNAVLKFKNTDATATTPSANKFNVIQYVDNSGTEEGRIDFYHSTTGEKVIRQQIVGQNGTTSNMLFRKLADGTAFVTAPNRAYNTANTSDVVTIGVLNSDITLDGVKTFSSNPLVFRSTPSLDIRTTKHTLGTVPTDNSNSYVNFRDNANVVNGRIQLRYDTGGNLRNGFQVFNTSGSATGELFLWKLSNDTSYVSASYRTYNKSNINDVMTIGHLNDDITIDGTKILTATPLAPNYNMYNTSLVQSANSPSASMTLNFLGRNSANTDNISRAYIQFYHSPGTDSASSTNLLYLRAYKDNCSDYTDLSIDAKNGLVGTNGTFTGASIRINGQQVMQFYNDSANSDSISGWGTLTAANGYTHVAGVNRAGGEFKLASHSNNSGQISAQLDGYFYQNEGQYRCLDRSDLTVSSGSPSGGKNGDVWIQY